MKKIILGVVILALIPVIGGLIWFDRQFEEPGAKHVPSIAAEFEAKSVLAVFAHPDDEQLITGLLIRAVEHDGAVTRMITMTKGEAGMPLPQISRIEDLGAVREAETLKNSYLLGVTDHLVWNYPDGGLEAAGFEDYVARVKAQMIEWQVDLVVTFWPESGFSNHPDHMAAGRAATQAVEELQAEQNDLAPRAIAYILAPRPMMSRFGGETGQIVVLNQPDPTHSMPGEAWAKIRGWKIYQSQRDFVQHAYGLPPGLVHRLYDKEHYHVVTFDSH